MMFPRLIPSCQFKDVNIVKVMKKTVIIDLVLIIAVAMNVAFKILIVRYAHKKLVKSSRFTNDIYFKVLYLK